MDTSIRAFRILAKLTNYRLASPVDAHLVAHVNGHLGLLIGCYMNPNSVRCSIGIFVQGLAICDGASIVEIPFVDIAEVTLPSGKESDVLILQMRNRSQCLLPVKGRRGKFLDSMEVLRFLNRVLGDIRQTTESSSAAEHVEPFLQTPPQ